MKNIKGALNVSFLIAVSLLLTNCGKKDFSAVSSSSEEAAGVRDPGTSTGLPGSGQPDTGLPTTTPGQPSTTPEIAKGDVCVAYVSNDYIVDPNNRLVVAPASANCDQDVTAVLKYQFFSCEPSYELYYVTKAQGAAMQGLSYSATINAVRSQTTKLKTFRANQFPCADIESGDL